ncbi:MAG: response regulator transcription factor, partial [Bacteroidota bacterium]
MKQARVLLLEDELQLAKIVTETLRKRDFAVTHVANGVLGLEAARKSSFDICVVDVMMPFMDGFSFVEQLRKTDKQMPVLFLTAKSQTDDVIKGYESGGNDYLKKPFSLEELILRMNELLRRSSAVQTPESIAIGKYTFYGNKQELWFDGGLHSKLSHRENELLTLLVQLDNGAKRLGFARILLERERIKDRNHSRLLLDEVCSDERCHFLGGGKVR